MAPYTASMAIPLLVGLLTLGADAAFKPPINNTLEHAVATECKTCPYSLCTNKAFYDYDTAVTLLCWTRGTVIDGDNTWLRTSDNCYVTQYDLMEYSGDYTTDLSYCGKASEEKHLTFDDVTTKYDAECNICPDYGSCETIQYRKAGTDLTVTCWTGDGAAVIDDTTWVKTTDNCYVAQIHLEEPANKAVLDNCGPIGFIQVNYTTNVAVASARKDQLIPASANSKAKVKAASWSRVQQREALAAAEAEAGALPAPIPAPLAEASAELHKRYLINITVGEDYAYCHEKTVGTSKVLKKYEFGKEVRMQCYVSTDSTVANESYWYKTTDFCYVREGDFFESLFDRSQLVRSLYSGVHEGLANSE
ncbi:uncharacterized protein RSE6_07642 [Rhynchosporium secalis]|uniref:Uncharacterized protein n=1 Tax=Rhynchosporium secalis TaxID=38038 RepID=A0A1E1MDC6_RHYSE|nr:uncharacterized protein RSE6_07642 [Rhynchosporium secalis]